MNLQFISFVAKHPLLAANAWVFVIILLCSFPGNLIPSFTWLDLLSIDKLVHAFIFFVFVILWLEVLFYYNQFKTVYTFIILILGIIFGGILEAMQYKIFKQRSSDWADFIANSIGCIVASLIYKNNLTPVSNAK